MSGVSQAPGHFPLSTGPYFPGKLSVKTDKTHFGRTEETETGDKTESAHKTEATDTTESTSQAPPKKKGVFATIREFVHQNGIIKGVKQFANVFADTFEWNKVFEAANTNSSYAERLQSLFYIGFAEFCEGFQSRNEELKSSGKKVTYALYANVLKSYPKLILAKPENLPINLVEKTLQAVDNEEIAETLKTIQAKYIDTKEPPLTELKREVEDALNT